MCLAQAQPFEVAMVLPSDMLFDMCARGEAVRNKCLFGPHGEASIQQYWEKEDPAFLASLGVAPSDLSTCVPLSFHEDGVPNWHDSTATFISFSTPMARGELGHQMLRCGFNDIKCVLKPVGFGSNCARACGRPLITQGRNLRELASAWAASLLLLFLGKETWRQCPHIACKPDITDALGFVIGAGHPGRTVIYHVGIFPQSLSGGTQIACILWRTSPCGFKCLAILGPGDCGTAPGNI